MGREKQKAQCGRRLAKLRAETPQAEFSALLGVSKSTLGSYERGERWPTLDVLLRLKKLTNVNLNWLAAGQGNPRSDGGSPQSAACLSVEDICSMIRTAEGIFEQVFEEHDFRFTPDQKADAYLLLLEAFLAQERMDNEAVVTAAKTVISDFDSDKPTEEI